MNRVFRGLALGQSKHGIVIAWFDLKTYFQYRDDLFKIDWKWKMLLFFPGYEVLLVLFMYDTETFP